MLRGGPLCVCQMTVIVELAGSTVSEHLTELEGRTRNRAQGRPMGRIPALGHGLRERLLESVWPSLEEDRQARADAVLVKELRRVPLEELCGVDLDLARIARPRLASAVEKAERIRASEAAG